MDQDKDYKDRILEFKSRSLVKMLMLMVKRAGRSAV